tara:strand:+ start:70 stop:456 length:387 start_codon:yes stop_codon:yes gene_type:complete
MRRIKSAPANLCMMCHNKIKNNKDSQITTPIINSNTSQIKITDIKSKKHILTTTSNIISDTISDSNMLSFEENFIFGFIITYIFENIIKKDKFKNLEVFIIQNGIRFLVSYLIHQHIIIDIVQTLRLH